MKVKNDYTVPMRRTHRRGRVASLRDFPFRALRQQNGDPTRGLVPRAKISKTGPRAVVKFTQSGSRLILSDRRRDHTTQLRLALLVAPTRLIILTFTARRHTKIFSYGHGKRLTLGNA
jgi:hypothetical protein